MPTNGMTIDSLNTVSSLTAQDEVPVWDKEASGEHTRKITAQNMANSVKSLASLPNTTEMNTAIDQSTADVIRTGDVVNSLTSMATDKPGSANMLKTLNDNITAKTNTLKKMTYAGYKASGGTLTPDGFGMGDLLMLYGDTGESVTIYTVNGNSALISIMQGNRTASLSWNGNTPTITFNNSCYFAFIHVSTVNNL